MAASVGAVYTINNTQYLYPFYLFNHFFFLGELILNTLDKELKVEEEQNNVLVVELNNVLA